MTGMPNLSCPTVLAATCIISNSWYSRQVLFVLLPYLTHSNIMRGLLPITRYSSSCMLGNEGLLETSSDPLATVPRTAGVEKCTVT